MVETLNLFRDIYRKWKYRNTPLSEVSQVYRFKYTCFRDLLDSNAELLNIITDMEEKLKGDQILRMSYIRSIGTRAAFHAFRMIKNLNVLSGHKYPELYAVLEKINNQIKEELESRKESSIEELILPYSRVNRETAEWVGGKSANLGEVKNRAGLPVPEGFAITTRAFELFLGHQDLIDEIDKRKMETDPKDPGSLTRVSEEIQRIIQDAPVPAELVEAINRAFDDLEHAVGGGAPPLRVSMRSSAIGEDSELSSYAGQYLTVLDVPREDLISTYKRIVASLHTPRAAAYRISKGILVRDLGMSVACVQMIYAVASGVMYSRHPFNILEDHIVITAVWGLGPYAVDGVITPDTYVVSREPGMRLVEIKASHKPVRLTVLGGGGIGEAPVPESLRDSPCLTEEQIRTLAGYALRLEEHYGGPQDIEWALDEQGRLFVLQARPLRMETAGRVLEAKTAPMAGYPLLIEKGDIACPGVGYGPVYVVHDEADLVRFPEGAVLVARHSSPKYVIVMPRAQAIVTDAGSVAGHMAAVAREFGVPTLMDSKLATSVLTTGMDVTVDAYAGRVYKGKVPELVALREARTPKVQDTPVHQTLKRIADLIVPLHLLDPKSREFAPGHCRSLHDLGRLVHEFSYSEMFTLSDIASERGGGALRLAAPIPLDLHIIDLENGLTGVTAADRTVREENIASAPFRALLKGMLHEELRAMGPRPVDFSGLLSVMREQMLSPSQMQERFGDRSYAIISDKYLNFSSRVGYHYSVLDAYCGETVNKNYITFSFKGGAADEVRRNRRVRALALILERLDFDVEVKGDRVDARFLKYPSDTISERLEMVGRLLQFTRQMDMLMASEASIDLVAENFLAGNYRLDPTKPAAPPPS